MGWLYRRALKIAYLWPNQEEPDNAEEKIRNSIYHVRKKLGDDIVRAIHGVGYVLDQGKIERIAIVAR
jgi:DNA-binding response OmpR family regulator